MSNITLNYDNINDEYQYAIKLYNDTDPMSPEELNYITVKLIDAEKAYRDKYYTHNSTVHDSNKIYTDDEIKQMLLDKSINDTIFDKFLKSKNITIKDPKEIINSYTNDIDLIYPNITLTKQIINMNRLINKFINYRSLIGQSNNNNTITDCDLSHSNEHAFRDIYNHIKKVRRLLS